MASSDLLTITPNAAQLAEVQAALNPRQFKAAIYSAVKKTTDKARTIVRKEVGERTFVKAKYIGRTITSSVSRGDIPVGTVKIKGRAIPAVGFKYRAYKKAGAWVQYSKDKPALIFRHAFKGTVRNISQLGDGSFELTEHVGLFLRAKGSQVSTSRKVGNLTPSGYVGRLPIKQIFGPSIPALVEQPAIEEAVRGKIQGELAVQLNSQVDRFLQRKKVA